jgi:peptidoglycan-associated lipoprotein
VKHGLKLMGLFLIVALVATSGCRKKKANGGSEMMGDPTDIGAGSLPGEVNALPDREVTEYGTRVDANLDPVMFNFDSTKVDDSEVAKAEKVASFLNENPAYKVVVEGNCDERGTAEYNMALGERRAQAVRACLLNAGVGESKVQTLSYGEEKPASPGHGESDWSQNRRADFAIYE